MPDLTVSSNVDSILAAADYAAVRTLLNVEDGADVTDATNVTAAGALMDSEVTNLAEVKAFDPADYATAAQGSTADSALQPGSALGTPSSGDLRACSGTKLVVKSTAADYTSGTTNALENYGGIIYVTAAATITLPAVADGMSVAVVTVGDVAVSVDPNASDRIYLDGVALDDGDKITNLSTSGDVAILTYYDATGWHAMTNGWSDGG